MFNDQAFLTQDMSFLPGQSGWSYSINSTSPLNHSFSTPFDASTSRVRKNPPVPIPNLTKKSRGRRVPTITETDSDGSGSSSGVTKTRLFRCTVASCGKCFLRGEHLKRHVRSIHTHDKRMRFYIIFSADWTDWYLAFKCTVPLCGKHFSRRDNLVQHLKIHKDHSAAFSAYSAQSLPVNLQFSDHDDGSDYQRSSTSPSNMDFASPSFDLPSTPPLDFYQPNHSQYPTSYSCERYNGAPTNNSSLRTEPLSSIALDYQYAMSNDTAGTPFPLTQPSIVYPQQMLMQETHSIGDLHGEPMQYFYH